MVRGENDLVKRIAEFCAPCAVNTDAETFSFFGKLEKTPRVPQLEAVLQFRNATYRKLHVGPFKEISQELRSCYAATCLLEVVAKDDLNEENFREEKFRELSIILDYGLILGGSDPMKCGLICELLHEYHQDLTSKFGNLFSPVSPIEFQVEKFDYSMEKSSLDLRTQNRDVSKKVKIIEIEETERLTQFVRICLVGKKPAVIRQEKSLENLPAIKKWSDPNYFLKNFKHRVIPVEVGSSYTRHNWSQKMLTFHDFIVHFYGKSNENVLGYLAQHFLLEQIPQLNNDILIPGYCDYGEDYPIRYVFMGNIGCHSPTHTDPFDNVYLQVVGVKYFRLFGPKHWGSLYLIKNTLTNTSNVQEEDLLDGHVDRREYSRFFEIPYMEGYLFPGDILFIPTGWFHYFKCCSRSISVSHWFEFCLDGEKK